MTLSLPAHYFALVIGGVIPFTRVIAPACHAVRREKRHAPCIKFPTKMQFGGTKVGKHDEFDLKDRRVGPPNVAREPRSERTSDQANLGPSTSISVLIADQYQLLLRGIASVLSGESDISLQAQAINGEQALRAIRQVKPDVALLSLKLPGLGALGVLDALKGEAAVTRTVILADHMDEDDFLRATQLGARGLVLWSMPPELLVRCIRMVHAGEEFIEKETLRRTFGKLVRELTAEEEVTEVLTTREFAVMELAVSGMSNKDVARELAITEGTVKAHLHSAYSKLGVHGRIGLFHYAKERGLF